MREGVTIGIDGFSLSLSFAAGFCATGAALGASEGEGGAAAVGAGGGLPPQAAATKSAAIGATREIKEPVRTPEA